MLAPRRSMALATPAERRSMKPCPSKKLMAVKFSPLAVSRPWVQVAVRASMSIWPDCSAGKRAVLVSGTQRILLMSFSVAAATARQMSLSMPR